MPTTPDDLSLDVLEGFKASAFWSMIVADIADRKAICLNEIADGFEFEDAVETAKRRGAILELRWMEGMVDRWLEEKRNARER